MNKIEAVLSKFINNEKTQKFDSYGLSNIRKISSLLKNPENSFKSFHIAGTNGKGSTAAHIHSLLSSKGLNPGLYTSPHLISLNERIRISCEISDDDLLSVIEEIIGHRESEAATYFDILTLAAFLYFKRKNVSHAVIECGLGGRLDSTNIITPEASIITTISKDHMHILGSTIEEIAREKCGIIKKNVPVVTGLINGNAAEIIRETALKNSSLLFRYGTEFKAENIRAGGNVSFDFKSVSIDIKNIEINNQNPVQAVNLSVAIQSCISSGIQLSEEEIRLSAGNFRIRGRFETLCKEPEIIFDAAHNEESICALKNTLLSRKNKKIKIFLSIMKDKDYNSVLDILNSFADETVLINLDDERALQTANAVNSDEKEKLASMIDPEAVNVFTGTFRIYALACGISSSLRG
ncbi:MAG: bifunctional folylpolyglutamate synthase/dihydrofolate synthase [Spirochaetes bacterium]|nr:bifunctional folylpolyglutamate synthase/dihydrofolate synthase [Spirochaetota bacterium]